MITGARDESGASYDGAMMPYADWQSLVALFVLSIPVACIARTVVYEEIFREPREFCKKRTKCPQILKRKFFYLFTCEYCFSHYVALAVLLVTHYRLLYEGWRGSLVAFFSIVFVANIYMAGYARLRVDITAEKAATDEKLKQTELAEAKIEAVRRGQTIDADAT